jgi:hypothetical protein
MSESQVPATSGGVSSPGRARWRPLARRLFRAARGSLGAANRFVSHLLVALALAVVALDLYCETSGLPKAAEEIFQAVMARHGLLMECERIRAGVLNGLVIEQVRLFDGSAPGHLFAEADSVELAPKLHSLVAGRLQLRSLAVNGLLLHYPVMRRGEDAGAPQLPPVRFDGSCRLRSARLDLSSLEGEVAGIRVHVSGAIRHLFRRPAEASAPPPATEPVPGLFGWENVLALLGPQVRAEVEPRLRTAARSGLPHIDGSLRLRVDVSLRDPAAAQIWGTLSVADIRVHGIDVRRLRTAFSLREQRLRFDHLFLQVIGDQSALASVEFDLASRRLSGRAEGVLDPQVAMRLLGRPVPGFLTEMRFASPVRFALTLRPSEPTPGLLDADAECSTGRLWYRELTAEAGRLLVEVRPEQRPRGNFTLSGVGWQGVVAEQIAGTLEEIEAGVRLRDVAVRFDAAGGQQVQGSLACFLDSGEVEFEAQGSLHPATLLRLLPDVPPALAAAGADLQIAGAPPVFACAVERSPFSPRQWRGRAELHVPEARFRDLAVQEMATRLEAREGVITLQQRVAFGDDGGQDVRLEAAADLAAGTLSGRVAGHILVDQLYCALRLPPFRALERLQHHGAPVAFRAELEPAGFDPRQWVMHGTLEATDTTYGGVRFHAARCQVELSPGVLLFRDLEGDTAAGDRLTGDLRVELPSGAVTIDAHVLGDPRFVHAFLGPRSAPKYLRIWEGFEWDPAHPVDGRISGLRYEDLPGGPGSWRLDGTVSLVAEQAAYRGTRADELRVTLDFALPARVHIADAAVRIGTAHATGDVRLLYQDAPLCQFRFAGVSEPGLVLRMINPAWERFLAGLSFPSDTEIECNGAFYLGPEARPRVRGRLRAPSCQYGSLPLEAFSLKWQIEEDRFSMAPLRATLHGGSLVATGSYNFFADVGDIVFTAEEIGLSALAGASTNMRGILQQGTLSANARIALLRPDEDGPLLLNGNGRVWVRDADLWKAPLLSALGQLMGFMSLGQITRLDADLIFAGDHVRVREFETDGTVFALKGQGDYTWGSKALAFTVRGEALKRTRIIPMLLRPLFWFFEAELSGTTDEPRWRQVRGLTRMFSSD